MENWRPFGSFPSKSAEAASTENSATKKKKKRKKKKNRSNAPLPAQNTTEPCGLWDGYPPIPNEAAPIPSLIPAGYISETTKRERRERKKRIEKDALDKRERPVITLSQTTMQAIGQIQQQLDHLDSAETCQEEPMEISYHDLPSPADDSQPPWNTRYETAYGLKQEAGCANSMNVDPGDDIDVSDLVGEGGMTDDYNPLYKPSKLQFDPYFECEARRGFERVQGFRKRSKFADIQEKLPISKQKTEIISLIENNPVTVISGETGSGKSTQVPQFILDTAIAKGKASQTYVVVTQPRRISAIALAARVSEERGEKVGESVGYKIRLEAKAPRNRGSILFCTYGIVLRWLHGDPDLSRVSHIVMDEVHERDLNSDFTLIIIRDILRRRPELKIILMSATLDADLFSKYFFDAPCINVPGVIFPVKQIFLEDIIERLNYFFPKRAQLRQGRMPREYLEMPDKAEGMAAWQAYQMAMCKWKQENQTKFHRKTQEVIMSWDESVLELELIGVRKIVVATNIAETSITIDDVVHVIDCGKIKMNSFDEKNNISTLRPEWESKANARQRRGRAGRVKRGFAYHLFTSVRNEMLEPYLLPEMKRVRVENLILQMKLLQLGKVKPFLAKAPEPPTDRSIELALDELIAIGAVEEESEELTSLGWHLARLPVEPHCGKMIVYGAMFSCLQPILTIASCLDYKNPFNSPMGKEEEVDAKKRIIAGDESISDYLLWCKVIQQIEKMPSCQARNFAEENFVSLKTVEFIRKLNVQYAQVLYEAGFLSSTDPRAEEANAYSSCEEIISAVVCAGLYPKVAESIPTKSMIDRSCMFKSSPKTCWGYLKPHLGSVVAFRPKIPSRFVAFHKVMRSSQTFMHNCGMVSPLSLCIFAGSMRHVKIGGDSYIQLDNWIRFHCSRDVIQAIELLRHEFDGILKRRIENPQPVGGTVSGAWVSPRLRLEELMMWSVVQMLVKEQCSFKN